MAWKMAHGDVRTLTEKRWPLIPEVMKQAQRWIVYELQYSPSSGPHAKPGKVPVSASGRKLKWTDTSTWQPFALALNDGLKLAKQRKLEGREPEIGVGFMLGFDAATDLHWSGIDLDDCGRMVDDNWILEPWAKAILRHQVGYRERSIGGNGVHIIGASREDLGNSTTVNGIECYSGGRFFTISAASAKGDAGDISLAWASALAEIATRKAGVAAQRGYDDVEAPDLGTPPEAPPARKRVVKIRSAHDDDHPADMRRDTPMSNINTAALRAAAHEFCWVSQLFPAARWQGPEGGWRISPEHLHLNAMMDELGVEPGAGDVADGCFQEDLCIHPTEGVNFFTLADQSWCTPHLARPGCIDLLLPPFADRLAVGGLPEGEALPHDARSAARLMCKLIGREDLLDMLPEINVDFAPLLPASWVAPAKTRTFPRGILPHEAEALADHMGPSLRQPADVYLATWFATRGMALSGLMELSVHGDRTYVAGSNMWLALIGNPGSAKSHVAGACLRPLRERQAAWFHHYEVAASEAAKVKAEKRLSPKRRPGRPSKAELAAQAKDAGTFMPADSDDVGAAQGGVSLLSSPEKPRLRRKLVGDVTGEALKVLLHEHGAGLILDVDELASVIGSWDRYASANGKDRSESLTRWDGGSDSVDRKGPAGVKLEPLFIPQTRMSMIATTQPGYIGKQFLAAEHGDDGLLERFVWVQLEAPREHVPDALPPADLLRFDDALTGLLMDADPVQVSLSPEARKTFLGFSDHCAGRGNGADGDEMLQSLWGKAPQHVLRFALTLHAIRWAAEHRALDLVLDEVPPLPVEMPAARVREAIRIWEDFFEPTWRDVRDRSRDRAESDLRMKAAGYLKHLEGAKDKAPVPAEFATEKTLHRNRAFQGRERRLLDALVARGVIGPPDTKARHRINPALRA